MNRSLRQLMTKMMMQLISLLVVALAGYAANYIAGELSGGSGIQGHENSVRSLVTKSDERAPSLLDIGGYAGVKSSLRQMIIVPMKNPHIFYDPSVPLLRPPSGILLTGPPGTGKTLFAKACARESGANFMSLHSAALESKWWGESPKLLQAAFRMARTTLSPCIIFFDEIDGLGRNRSEQDQSCVYSFKCELLRNMDGIDKDVDSPVVVLGCTNCPKSLDPALLRRFTRHLSVPLPNRKERRDILSVVCKRETDLDEALLGRVAENTEGFTGADLASLYNEACNHRWWTTTADVDEDLGHIKDGGDFLKRMGALTETHWTHSGRLKLPPHQNARVPDPTVEKKK